MARLQIYNSLLMAILLASASLSATATEPNFSTTKNLQLVAQANPPTPENPWNRILGKTSAPKDWQVKICDPTQTAPLLCITSKEKSLGTVEAGVYPIESLPNFQKMLARAGIPVNSNIDYQSPKYQRQVLVALKAWVAEYYKTFSEDLKPTYGKEIKFSAQFPQQISFGKLQGMRYGWQGSKRQGAIHEQHLGYVAFDGKALYIISTAFDPASETGKFDKLEDFRRFQSHLSAIVKSLQFP